MIILRVSKDEKGEGIYGTIGEALSALPEDPATPAALLLAAGTYTEKIEVHRSNLTIRGEGPDQTTITYGDYANMLMEDGTKRGTFRSYTLFLDGDNITLQDLKVENSAYPRKKVGQALALYADGDRIRVLNCHLDSWQDTLFTGPLPPSALSKGGFTGPKEFAERRVGKQYYANCRIRGDVDFIFGSAIAYFENCEIISRNALGEPDPADPKPFICGYTTAASTPEGYPYGYVFEGCDFLAEDCPPESVYLGRPWRNFAKTVLLRCHLGPHIRKEGFHDWNKPEAHETMFYAEYENDGPGADPTARDSFVHQLSAEEASQYTKETVLDGWDPLD